VQYLESDLILSVETEGLTRKGITPKRLKIKNRKSTRLQERREIWLGFSWLGRVDTGMLPQGLKGVGVGTAHLENELANVRGNLWSAHAACRFPAPICSEPSAMPTDYCLRCRIVSVSSTLGAKR